MNSQQAMSEALKLAELAGKEGEVPVGAVVLDEFGNIVGSGRNSREFHGDPLAHAEIEALRQAAQHKRELLFASATHDVNRLVDSTQHEYSEQRGDVESDMVAAGSLVTGSLRADKTRQEHTEQEHTEREHKRNAAWNLAGYTLVVTLEPCPMCAGATLQSHISRVIFGAWDAKLGACGSVWDILRDPHIGHRAEVVGGVQELRCSELLSNFFGNKR